MNSWSVLAIYTELAPKIRQLWYYLWNVNLSLKGATALQTARNIIFINIIDYHWWGFQFITTTVAINRWTTKSSTFFAFKSLQIRSLNPNFSHWVTFVCDQYVTISVAKLFPTLLHFWILPFQLYSYDFILNMIPYTITSLLLNNI